MKRSWVRRHIASFKEGVPRTAIFRAVQIFKKKSENAKFLYSLISLLICYI